MLLVIIVINVFIYSDEKLDIILIVFFIWVPNLVCIIEHLLTDKYTLWHNIIYLY